MDTLDNPRMTDPGSVPYLPTAVRYGLLGGLVSIVYFLLSNMIGFGRPSAGFGMLMLNLLISIVISVMIAVFAIRHHRDKELGGFIALGRGFLVGFIALITASILGTIFNLIYVNYIEPDYVQTIMSETMDMMEGMGLPEEQLDAALEQTQSRFTPARMMLQGIIGAAVMGGIISIIVAAIMKRDPVSQV